MRKLSFGNARIFRGTVQLSTGTDTVRRYSLASGAVRNGP